MYPPSLLILLLAATAAAQTLSDTARTLYLERKFSEASRALEKHLSQHPDDVSSRLLLALCRQQAGDNSAAESVLREAVRRHPHHPETRFQLARVQFLLAKFTEAETNARLALQLGTPEAQAYNLLGLILAGKNSNDQALEAYQSSIRADPQGFADPHLNSGTLLLKLGRPAEALERLRSAIEINPDSAEALYQRGRAYLELKQQPEAEKDLAQAVALAHHEQARLHLARIRSRPAPPPIVPFTPIRFRDVAKTAGLSFVLENHPTPHKHLVETMPGGVAAFDYNNDGLPDIYFTNGAALPSLEKNSPKYSNRLYRNDGGMKFTDVTAPAGVAAAGYSMGVAAADFDNDGHTDLFVAGVNRNILYRNTGKGTFEDVTRRAGIRSDVWSVAAGWLDYDNDGLLDLFVVNYVKWSPSLDPFCGDAAANIRVYCHPRHFEGLPNTLYRNRGDGTFEDVSQSSGIAAHTGKGMSVAFADYDHDGFLDIFVPNDAFPNFLFRNRGDGTFEEVALSAGVALTADGKPVSSMGADFRDYDNDGLADLTITALAGETFPLFRNLGKNLFEDVTYPSRIALLSAPRSGWSNGFFDFNNDGWKDLFSANSHVMDNIELIGPHKYRQPNSIFANLGNGTFQDVSTGAGETFQVPRAHRGAAFTDFNNDGKIDVVVTSLGEPVELWENISPGENRWILLKLEGTRSNRDGIGARVHLAGRHNHMTTSVGYASSSHHGIHFGAGRAETIDKIEVLWPSGIRQSIENPRSGQVLTIREPGP